MIWRLAWRSIATDHPADNPHMSEEEVLFIKANPRQASPATAKEKVTFFYFVTKPTILFTALAFFSLNYILYFFITWFPSYLVNAKNLSIQGMSILTAAPWLTGYIIQNTGAYSGAFIAAGCLAIIGALSVAVFVKPIPP